jgi:hypothetical protein
MDTGKMLWRVEFRSNGTVFNVIAKDSREAERKARSCAKDAGVGEVRELVVRHLESIGTLDEPKKPRRAHAKAVR